MQERLALVWNGLLDLVYPPCCLLCGVGLESGAMCAACQQDILPIQPPYCDRCGVPIIGLNPVCAACAEGQEPPFAWSQALGHYSGTLRQAIHLLKYESKTALAEPLGVLLSRSLDTPTPLLPHAEGAPPGFDLVVPIPLHPSRYRQRGFNQSESLASVVARERGWRLDTHGLRRIKRTQSQADLSGAERANNVQGAFAAHTPLAFSGRSVLLIDDVLTTMATVREAAGVVANAGATRVGILALARGG